MGDDSGTVRVLRSEGILAEHQRQEVNILLRRLFASKYTNGGLDIARLCLLWKTHNHPAQQEVLDRLRELGSQQEWFHPPGPAGSTSKFSYYVGFGDAGSQTELEEKLDSLHIGGNAQSVDEEVVVARFRMQLSHQMTQLGKFEKVAAEVSSCVQLSITLQMTMSSPERTDLPESIADLAKDLYYRLTETTALVQAALPLLVGEVGVIRSEEQPKRCLIKRADGRNILDSVILDIERLANLAFRCLLLLSGLLAQGRLLLRTGDPVDGATNALFEIPNDLEKYLAGLDSTVGGLRALREQLDTGEQLIEFESPVILLPQRDKGLTEVYKEVRRLASLRQTS